MGDGTAHITNIYNWNVFSAFNNYRDLHLRKLNPVVLKRFEMHLRQRDCSWNTVSTYMKVIRSAYNRAVDLRLCPLYFLKIIEHVYTGTKARQEKSFGSFGYRNFSSRDRNGFVQKDSFLKPSKGQNAICFYVYDAWSPICRFSFLAQERPARECIVLS